MTIEELAVEKAGLLEQKEWLESRIRDIEIDLAANEMEAEDIINKMEKELKNG